jgi:heme exporter protein D
MEPFFGVFGLMGILISLVLPIAMIVLFIMLVTSTKRQEAMMREILAELKRKNTDKYYLNQ